MGMDVYANGMSIACKAADGKTIAAMPDVCLSPPTPPAGPVPIPYPNTAMASDTDQGTKTVQIGGQEVMMKDSSTFKKSSGDEAATKSLGMGVVTACIQGEVTFVAWSMDVKFEGANVPRHLDLTLHNEQSVPSNTPTWPYLDGMTMSDPAHPCVEDQIKEIENCREYTPYGDKDPCPPTEPYDPLFKEMLPMTAAERRVAEVSNGVGFGTLQEQYYSEMAYDVSAHECLRARRCSLGPYNPSRCCPGQTPHHLVEASAFHVKGRGDKGPNISTGDNVKLSGCGNYNMNNAPCVCVEGNGHGVGTHGLIHTFQSAEAIKCPVGPLTDTNKKSVSGFRTTTVGDAQKSAGKAVKETFPESGCNPDCIEAQLKAYHEAKPEDGGAGLSSSQPIKAVHTCNPDTNRITEAQESVQSRVDVANSTMAQRGSRP